MVSDPDSIEEIRQGLVNLYNPRALETLPLTATLITARKIRSPAELSDFLTVAIEKLKPGTSLGDDSLPSRRYRYLRLRYIDYRHHEEIARELGISPRQARRIHQDALACLHDVIRWVPEVSLTTANQPESTRGTDVSRLGISAATGISAESESPVTRELQLVGRQPPDSSISLPTVIESIRDSCLPMLSARAIALEIDVPRALRPVWYNRVSLRQVLFNALLYLARSQATRSIRLEVTQTTEGTTVSMRYRDVPTCAVVPLEASESDAGRMLNAARYLANLQDSQLSLLTTSDTVLGVELRIPARSCRTIVLIDDNPQIGLMFNYMLDGSPYHTIHVRTADRALRISHDQQPSVIILDVVMPARDGWEILSALRQDPATVAVPVVVCSVLPDRDLALSLGAADFLDKPVTRDRLLETLDRISHAGRGA